MMIARIESYRTRKEGRIEKERERVGKDSSATVPAVPAISAIA